MDKTWMLQWEKKNFNRLGLVKAPYMVVACVPLALWLYPHIQHFMLCYVNIQCGIKPLECCNSFVHEFYYLVVQPNLWNLEKISRMHIYSNKKIKWSGPQTYSTFMTIYLSKWSTHSNIKAKSIEKCVLLDKKIKQKFD